MGLVFPAYAAIFVNFKKNMFWFFFGGCIAAGLFVGGFSYFLASKIIFSVFKNLSEQLKQMASGNLSQRTQLNSEDEIGEMATNFNIFCDNLSDMIKQIINSTNNLLELSESLSGFSNTTSKLSKDMYYNSNHISNASEEATQQVEILNKFSGQFGAFMAMVLDSINELTVNMDEVLKRSQMEREKSMAASNQSRQSDESIQKLTQSSFEISQVVDAIKDIAERTNILALNATIEASSAGEAGKGFAVVAGEVKELALQTVEAAEEIDNHTESIRFNTNYSAKTIGSIGHVINDIYQLSESIAQAVQSQGNSLNQILAEFTELKQNSSNLSKNVEASVNGLKNISSNLGILNKDISQINDGVMGMDKSTGNLRSIIKLLKESTEKFQL